jgi:hypothetical protein
LASQNLSEKFVILIPTDISGNAQPRQGPMDERVTPDALLSSGHFAKGDATLELRKFIPVLFVQNPASLI